MTDRDLTPAEARAEVEAFMGPGWTVQSSPGDEADRRVWVRAYRAHGVTVSAFEWTYRAAVAALKQAWRDAVRPWVVKADSEGFKAGMKAQQYVVGSYGVKEGDLELDVHRVARVLGEVK